ncbi:putative signal peptide protein [Puccinia sorghi]|uniref:Putative signal peptide protein n=1 Tax=Puccinia sorghi TaxID=27349 RepID=A0A0L6VKB3_9BASI|nr:putative signal peptide protein [Puccinia sorghi]
MWNKLNMHTILSLVFSPQIAPLKFSCHFIITIHSHPHLPFLVLNIFILTYKSLSCDNAKVFTSSSSLRLKTVRNNLQSALVKSLVSKLIFPTSQLNIFLNGNLSFLQSFLLLFFLNSLLHYQYCLFFLLSTVLLTFFHSCSISYAPVSSKVCIFFLFFSFFTCPDAISTFVFSLTTFHDYLSRKNPTCNLDFPPLNRLAQPCARNHFYSSIESNNHLCKSQSDQVFFSCFSVFIFPIQSINFRWYKLFPKPLYINFMLLKEFISCLILIHIDSTRFICLKYQSFIHRAVKICRTPVSFASQMNKYDSFGKVSLQHGIHFCHHQNKKKSSEHNHNIKMMSLLYSELASGELVRFSMIECWMTDLYKLIHILKSQTQIGQTPNSENLKFIYVQVGLCVLCYIQWHLNAAKTTDDRPLVLGKDRQILAFYFLHYQSFYSLKILIPTFESASGPLMHNTTSFKCLKRPSSFEAVLKENNQNNEDQFFNRLRITPTPKTRYNIEAFFIHYRRNSPGYWLLLQGLDCFIAGSIISISFGGCKTVAACCQISRKSLMRRRMSLI